MDTFPNIDKNPFSIFSFSKTICLSEVRHNKLACWGRLNNLFPVTIKISTLSITTSAKITNLFLLEFILMWNITIRFKFVILISYSFVLKSSFVVTVVIKIGSRIFLVWQLFEVPSEEDVWATILGITSWWTQKMFRFKNSVFLDSRAFLVQSNFFIDIY